MAYLMIDGMQMYYAEHGTLDGLPLVLLHGFTENGDFWVNQRRFWRPLSSARARCAWPWTHE